MSGWLSSSIRRDYAPREFRRHARTGVVDETDGIAHDSQLRELVESLAGHGRALVRVAVAPSPLTPADLLERLAHDPSVEVRRAVAANPVVSPEAMFHLAGDSDPGVLAAVARNRGAPHDAQAIALARLEEARGEPRLLSDDEIRRVEEQTKRLRG